MLPSNAKDHMTKNPVTLSPDTGVEAIHALVERSISGATVVDANGMVVGIVSEMDCLKSILSGAYHGEMGGTVASVMTRDVECVEEGESVMTVAKKLIDGHRRRFPVVREGRFVGQISCRSILNAVSGSPPARPSPGLRANPGRHAPQRASGTREPTHRHMTGVRVTRPRYALRVWRPDLIAGALAAAALDPSSRPA